MPGLRAFYSDFLLHSILTFSLHGARSQNSASKYLYQGGYRAGIADNCMDAALALSLSLHGINLHTRIRTILAVAEQPVFAA